jgi:putative transposase
MLRQTFQYRLSPTPAQETLLERTLETCRNVYNSMVLGRKHDYEVHGKAPSCTEQQGLLPRWKKAHPELACVYSQVLQDVVKRVDLAGYPRLRG